MAITHISKAASPTSQQAANFSRALSPVQGLESSTQRLADEIAIIISLVDGGEANVGDVTKFTAVAGYYGLATNADALAFYGQMSSLHGKVNVGSPGADVNAAILQGNALLR